jgi:serine/threonine-protein kinase
MARLAGLPVEVVEQPSAPELWGQVLGQEPAAGVALQARGQLTITVGARPHVTVPDVRGRDEEEALSLLHDAGLGAARRATRRSNRVPEGCIVRTRPRPGAEVVTGSTVSYVLAAGRRDSGADRKGARQRVHVGRLPDGAFLSLPEPPARRGR